MTYGDRLRVPVSVEAIVPDATVRSNRFSIPSAPNPAALADAMARLLSDPQLCAEMGARGKERFLKYFEFEPFYMKITQVYSELTRS